MSILRRTVLAVADNESVSRFFQSSSVTRSLVSRFVAGEELESAIVAAQELEAQGIDSTVDLLGENVDSLEACEQAVASFSDILRAMRANNLEPNISIKLTMLGLDLGEAVAREHTSRILEVARAVDGFVRIDMEGSAYTDVTMRIFEELFAEYPQEVGIVIQTYLHRAEDDVRRAIDLGARVRLVKGAYAEPESVAFQDKVEVDENYARLTRMLLSKGNFPAIATHDMALVRNAVEYARRHGIPGQRFEFQMLYGVRRDQQLSLVADGYGMRVYVPYGTQWYPYFTRRIAERPSNALFVMRQLAGR